MNTEEEIWKTYQKCNFIEVSNLGRVRSKDRVIIRKDGTKYPVNGKVLKQYLNPDGYMQVNFKIDGKRVCLRVHRIVAETFLPNPDNLPEINHIDCNPINNSVSNLEWCDHKYNIAYREKYGTPAKEFTKVLRKPVIAVNLTTLKVLHFGSQSEASRRLRIPIQNISKVLKGELNTAGGYLFVGDESEITKEKIQKVKSDMLFRGGVIAINLNTLKVLYFESQHEAARQLGVAVQNINHVVKGGRNKTGEYWFCHADKKAVENVRIKFGDKVASEGQW